MSRAPRKTILITGASSGIGFEMARQFVGKGHDLAFCARRMDKLEQLKAGFLHSGGRVEVRELEVNNHHQVASVFSELADKFGGLDRIIVNAGIAGGSRIGTGEFDKNRLVLETNLISALAQIKAVLTLFRARAHGYLALISSLSGRNCISRLMATYSARKAGLSYWESP
ncbi:short subunit dehydrogenase [Pseudomonas sp. SJZ103]|uniref:SDR family NAD(P)-dependent oxidoreductase n=1 Tax=unclassified Pseudomonas TaxID=196821 RepID=UPI0011AC17EC|nr:MULTISPECIES: SDR family NAD(P)-dependent oxidoreductase [unclassified Pseudomonas]MBB6290639.1 NADP-dependent 3-hydroxy acid dehydrogenase YdfG [Pseudomonas sp. SJZ073]MBB6315633.1 NADP-dependent 3-hydroxy acid dehydrogenase YdfG [Pseudomonas sp. JAI120]TWC63088.1 short subunit dehydrogenase [Pseudomonas sp. SJZ103]TWC80223.1 short subunit dehydrogenase [Pseudomonas sp. SJZ094]